MDKEIDSKRAHEESTLAEQAGEDPTPTGDPERIEALRAKVSDRANADQGTTTPAGTAEAATPRTDVPEERDVETTPPAPLVVTDETTDETGKGEEDDDGDPPTANDGVETAPLAPEANPEDTAGTT